MTSPDPGLHHTILGLLARAAMPPCPRNSPRVDSGPTIPFRSVCEHHLLPFSGVAHVGYLPADRIVGLSKLARLAEHFAARPQTQERLTRQIADCLDAHLRPRGAGVVLEAEHSCMTVAFL